MYIKNLYPYLSCGNFRNENGYTFFTPDGVVEIENVDKILNVILKKCNGDKNVGEILDEIGNHFNFNQSDVEDVFQHLFELGIVVDKYSVFKTTLRYSQNPMLFFRDISHEELCCILKSENKQDPYSESICGCRSDSVFLNLLEKRRSTRTFNSEGVTEQDLFDIFWASYGIQDNRKKDWCYGFEKTHTVPSGGGLFSLVLYLLNFENTGKFKKGLYRWNCRDKFAKLQNQCDVDAMKASINGIDSFNGVNSLLIICSDFDRVSAKYANKALPLVLLEAGHVMQNAYLCCADKGVGFVEILGFDHDEICKHMRINDSIQPIVIGAIGGMFNESD